MTPPFWSRELFRAMALVELIGRTRREQRVAAALAEGALLSIAEGVKR